MMLGRRRARPLWWWWSGCWLSPCGRGGFGHFLEWSCQQTIWGGGGVKRRQLATRTGLLYATDGEAMERARTGRARWQHVSTAMGWRAVDGGAARQAWHFGEVVTEEIHGSGCLGSTPLGPRSGDEATWNDASWPAIGGQPPDSLPSGPQQERHALPPPPRLSSVADRGPLSNTFTSLAASSAILAGMADSFGASGGGPADFFTNEELVSMNIPLARKQNAWAAGPIDWQRPPIVPSNDRQMSQRRESSERHAPSNSTSPYLANTIAPPKNTTPQSSNLLPSPSPSDDLTMEPPSAPLRRSPDNFSDASRPPTPMEAVRKRAAVRGLDHLSKRHASSDMSASRPVVTQRQNQVPHRQASQTFTRPQPVQQFVPPGRPQSQFRPQNLTMPQHQQVQTPVRSYSNPEMQNQQQARSQPGTPTLPPSIPDANYFTIGDCEARLGLLMNQAGNQLSRYDRQRISVLEDALKRRDLAYLTVHQYYCMAQSCPHLLPLGLRSLPELKATLEYLAEVLGSNEGLSCNITLPNQNASYNLLEWFAAYPYPLAQIAVDWPTRYHQEQQSVIRFAKLFGSQYLPLKEYCNRRGWPPLARELYDVLGINSTTLRAIVWRCMRRSIWNTIQILPVDPSVWEQEAETLFEQNERTFLARWNKDGWISNGQVASDEEDSHYRKSLQALLHSLKKTIDSLLRPNQQRRPQATLAHSPTIQQNNCTGPPQGVNHSPPFGSLPDVAQAAGIQRVGPIGSVQRVHSNAANAYVPQPRRGPGRPRIDDGNQATLRNGPGRPQLIATHGPIGRPTTQQAPPRNLPQSNLPQLAAREYQLARPIYPPRGYQPPQPIDPNPARSAIHQGLLRSPVLIANQLNGPMPNLLYRYVKGFAVTPKILSCNPLPPNPPKQTWTFSIDKFDFARIAKDRKREPSNPASRIIDGSAETYRLRCVKWTSNEAVTEPMWFTADSAWIPSTYFKLNGNRLEPRRKLHHGKDLPIDLTTLLREGENQLEISTIRKYKGAAFNYALAIEIVGVTTHENIKLQCTKNRQPASNILNAIRASLAGLDADDDLCITSSNISITLFDPISAYKIFDIPVRGRDCQHKDCFDLETFLQTRKRKHPTWPTVVDNWRCPICKADVRPSTLFVDGFMEEVRKTLAEKALLDTREIIVDQDGSWKPKPEKRDKNSVRDPDTPEAEEPQPPQQSSTALPTRSAAPDPQPRPQRVVIDLDD
ncbi:hypothetical protein BU16DRAFT_591313 [Lophium mytilinum]|uniref:SP-RING-type domain-containing protein n=1 Tax=Lophium mytilinum TaxID=390894 RepID=A0A6A6QQ90_9PEZI|nr:hypothetical protein BU16DRAFT_591313 [Lophium mytilinum]